MEQGWKNRSVGATSMNDESSRSHSIFTVSIEMMSTGLKEKLNLIYWIFDYSFNSIIELQPC